MENYNIFEKNLLKNKEPTNFGRNRENLKKKKRQKRVQLNIKGNKKNIKFQKKSR